VSRSFGCHPDQTKTIPTAAARPQSIPERLTFVPRDGRTPSC
jgi:hypothetical protein